MGIRTCCSEMVGEVLEAVIPNRTKRLIMISSLCPILTRKDELTTEYLTMLNTQLSVCREEEAFKLPMMLSESIWGHLSEEIDDGKQGPETVLSRIAAKIPEWLKYDKDNVILNEIQSLLQFNSVFHEAHMH